ncbi:membrane protein [Capnocytophaga stomatis]|uniref:YfhO family protein n=1 Tax=Capnocytophaga stomatis TaxID=1848904 RepID=UPI0019501FE3|nr:YfhO family protein [Capnocytophaga stomatis]GIJ95678.1 membrane protein [Capnocytophaga stomatis]
MKKLIPHFVAIGLFIVISLAFFYPVLQGKAIFQSDIVQYTGMAKERNDFRASEKKESYWTNSAFGGMPTYQLGANYPYDFIKKVDKAIRFLPRPADYLFLYFIGFYILLLTLKIDTRTAFLGAVAFGFSTYLIIILGVGHNAKAHAIGYFAPILAGILLVFNKKYFWGGLLTALTLALEINANHFQMTYYLMLLVLILGGFMLYKSLKTKTIPQFLKAKAVLLVAALLSLLSNATSLLATQEYTKWSTRGKSELTIAPDGTPKTNNGLSKEYITEYSYGIAESLNLIVPRLFGGSNNEALGENSNTYQFLVKQGVPSSQALEFADGLPTYWGNQPIVAAPAYIGSVIFFLFVLSLFLVKGYKKWWLLGGTIMALLLSWGKNFGFLTDLMIDYFPLYDKFRAVSSIQVILELCVPILAMLGLYQFTKNNSEENKKPLFYSLCISMGILLLLFLTKGFFDFKGVSDALYEQYYGKEVVAMIMEDRQSIYTSDLLRTIFFVLLTTLALFLYQNSKIPKWGMQLALLLLVILDLGGVANRYVNSSDFVQARQMLQPFQATQADSQILEDESYFRVYEPEVGINGARTSYFHHSIGGYHAAKPKRLQELFDYQISKGNMEVLNMLNVKYVLLRDEKGQTRPMQNEDALGNAWFVSELKNVKTNDEMMANLTKLNPKKEAIILADDIAKSSFKTKAEFAADSTATISLKSYQPNKLVYESNNQNAGFAVFSEMHYPYGWKATIDGKEEEYYRVNYLLRGMPIPAGKHTIVFEFEPEVVTTGSTIALMGNILLVLLLLGGVFWEIKTRKTQQK